MTAIQKTHFADDDTLLYIKQLEDRCKALEQQAKDYQESCRKMFNQYCDLQTKHSQLEDRCKALELSAKKANEEAEELRAALRTYADPKTYEAYHDADFDHWCRPIDMDRGEIARAALGESNEL